ncbi:Protein-cysteine N-palmitoyltransferase Rasp [Frankliniella fusca]|uniref:Protein-cysteine N-palmitoyltransferase Rasp n=1 Tax=Frankliniella fusca TaxID=407009 RepID=A0AAE1HKG3_9NEOP|nr:Protein-cysteine N-palmitoyltransferase Rasp [Frankliniella fusca]
MGNSSITLPRIEVICCFLIWVGGVFYSAYCVHVVSNSFGEQSNWGELEPGWSFLGRKKDISDYEWYVWLPFLRNLLPWFIVHHVGAELFRWCKSKELLRIWYILVTSVFTANYCGVIPLVALTITPIFLFYIAKLKWTLICWLTSILLLISLSLFQTSLLSDEQIMVLCVCCAWAQLRCMSFCMDWINGETWSISPISEDDQSPQILRLLSYIFYLPLMYLGPFVPFQDFEKSISINTATIESFKKRIIRLSLNSSRFLGWMILTELLLHFIYCNAIQLHHEALPFLDSWTLFGLAYCIGQFFLNKYVVIYGLMGTLAEFDAINAPPVPRCIAHISMYSDMWRHFDRGFYNFLRGYIYDPLLERFSSNKKRHILLTTVCFAFVYIWHGLSLNIFVWSAKLSPANVRRWRAFVTCPLFILSALTMFFFLGGMEVGTVFVAQIYHGTLLRHAVLLMFAYCMCQVSTEVKLIKERRLASKLLKSK